MRETEKYNRQRARTLRKDMTKAEVILWQHLRRKQLGGYRFKRQLPIGFYIVDFACVEQKLVVEVDGATHSSDEEIAYDMRRADYLLQQGWSVYRVWNTDIYENLEGTLDGIRNALDGGTAR